MKFDSNLTQIQVYLHLKMVSPKVLKLAKTLGIFLKYSYNLNFVWGPKETRFIFRTGYDRIIFLLNICLNLSSILVLFIYGLMISIGENLIQGKSILND